MTKRRPLSLAIIRSLPPAVLTLLFIALLFALTPLSVAGQSATATLSGTITDQNGAAIPGAAVTVTNVATRLKREAVTNDQGYFTVPLLPPATYTVGARKEGFGPIEVPNVILNVGDHKALTIELKAGDINATVQVVNEAPLINESPVVGTVVDRQFVANIPLNGRSFQSLITLTPGVVTVPSSTNFTGQFSVNGQRSDANVFMVDGVSGNIATGGGSVLASAASGSLPGLTTFGTTQSLVSVDAMQEFRVLTSTYSAEFGRQPGGQVSIVTRSGTNQFHGSAFDYLRNDVFDANDWFANANRQPKPPERQNDFGGNFSGPVILPRFCEGGHHPGYNGRNRTFFFFSYEGLQLRLPQFTFSNVPTLALRQNAPLAMQPMLKAFPLPNGKDLGNGLAEFSASYSSPSSLNATSIRIDQRINDKWTVFGRYNRAPSQTVARTGSDLALARLTRIDTETLTLGVMAGLTANASNDLRVNYSNNRGAFQETVDQFGGATPVSASDLIPSQYNSNSAQEQVRLNFPGRTAASLPFLGIINGRFDSPQRQFNLIDGFSYVMGNHQLKFGVDYRRLAPIYEVNTYNLIVIFANQQEVMNAKASSALVGGSVAARPIFSNFSAYYNDTWKLSPRLTANFGLRWDINPPPHTSDSAPLPAVSGIKNLATMQLAPRGTPLWKTTYNNFAPRVGLAYQISQKAERETIVRGGFGVFYDSGNNLGALTTQGYPFTVLNTITNVIFPLSPVQVTPAPVPVLSNLVPPYGTMIVFDPNLKLPYTLQWNVAVERALGREQVLTVSYVGAAGRRLLQQRQLNLSTINPSFTVVSLTTNKATSDYNALQTQFQRRLSHGLQALASYTWSHALDDDSADNGTIIPVRGNAVFDTRHIFATAITYDFPKPGNNRILNVALGRSAIDTSVHAQSAAPVDITGSTLVNPVDGSLVAARANLVSGVPLYVNDPTVPGGRRINRAAFTIPAAGTFGNLGRNVVRGFGAWQVDTALRREFKLTEKLRLQFRAEAFNVFNHPNFGAIQTTLTAANFGQATTMLNRQLGGISQLYQIGGPRSFQFAMKVLY